MEVIVNQFTPSQKPIGLGALQSATANTYTVGPKDSNQLARMAIIYDDVDQTVVLDAISAALEASASGNP